MSVLKPFKSGSAITADKIPYKRTFPLAAVRKNFGTLIFEALVYKIDIKDDDG